MQTQKFTLATRGLLIPPDFQTTSVLGICRGRFTRYISLHCEELATRHKSDARDGYRDDFWETWNPKPSATTSASNSGAKANFAIPDRRGITTITDIPKLKFYKCALIMVETISQCLLVKQHLNVKMTSKDSAPR